ncbi:MAG: hypothetical protein ACRCV9_07135 [Burkholderiaceae bacterium]
MNAAATLDLSSIPRKYAANWHILSVLRADAQVEFAKSVADADWEFGSVGWGVSFDSAAADWLAQNPLDPVWASGRWPDGASMYLGSEALDDARRLLKGEAVVA